jgi:hypothetical protein
MGKLVPPHGHFNNSLTEHRYVMRTETQVVVSLTAYAKREEFKDFNFAWSLI